MKKTLVVLLAVMLIGFSFAGFAAGGEDDGGLAFDVVEFFQNRLPDNHRSLDAVLRGERFEFLAHLGCQADGDAFIQFHVSQCSAT